MKWFVYILQCKDKKLYTGITNNIEKRIKTHNKGEGCRFTRGRLPVEILYKEELSTKSEALRREIKIKNLSRKDKFKIIRGV